jgi:hypothetical protein
MLYRKKLGQTYAGIRVGDEVFTLNCIHSEVSRDERGGKDK